MLASEKHKVKYKKEYNKQVYEVTIEKPKDLNLSVFLSDFLFYNSLKDKKTVKAYLIGNGGLGN